MIALEGAEPLATFTEGFYAGRPALTQHSFGAGRSFYLGTRLDGAGMAWLLEKACQAAGIDTKTGFPEGVEAVRRVSDGASYLTLLNHTDKSVQVELSEAATDLAQGETRVGELTLPPYGVTFLRLQRPVLTTERVPVKGA